MNLSTQPYKGARDFYPEDMRVRNRLFEVWRNVCQLYGYEEYDAPILEPVELFAAKSGDELVNEQSYNFVDRGGREVMLRPEITPSVARMVAGRRQELPLPIRWFSIPSCWRYERPQKGRGREFYQLNVDLFGVDGVEAEVEMVQMIDSLMKGFSATADMYEIRVNSRKFIDYLLGDWLGLNEVESRTISRLIDRMNKMSGPEFKGLIEATVPPTLREQGAAERLLSVLEVKSLSDLPEDLQQSAPLTNLTSIVDQIKEAGIANIKFDISLMRGLDYYTDFVFEVFDNNPENNRAMFGGGRYDGLVGLFGVEPLPTIGFAISDIVLMEFLKAWNLTPKVMGTTEVTVIPIGDVQKFALKVASELREMGVNTAIDITDRKTDKKLKAAIKSGVRYVMFVGEQEIESGQFKLKNLSTSTEESYSLQRIVSVVKDYRSSK